MNEVPASGKCILIGCVPKTVCFAVVMVEHLIAPDVLVAVAERDVLFKFRLLGRYRLL
jgi:hypothetical protein